MSTSKIRVTEERLLGPIGRTKWDDNGFAEHPVEECREPLVVLEGIGAHSALAAGARKRISPFWGDGTGALKNMMLGRESTYYGLQVVNRALASFDLELLLVEAFRSARMQAGGFANVFWRPDGGMPNDPRVALDMPIEDFLKRAYAARKGYLENGVVEDDLFQDNVQRYLHGLGSRREILAAADKFGKSPETIARWLIKYYANLLGQNFASLNVAGNRPHGTGAVVDAVLQRRSTGLPVYMGAPSDDTGDGMHLKTLGFFEQNSYEQFLAELERDHVSKAFVADFAEDYGTTDPTERHYDDAKMHRRLLANSMFLIVGAGGYDEGDGVNGEYWHFPLPRSVEGPGDPTWMVLNGRTEPAIYGSEFAHQEAARIVGAEYVY